MNDPSVRKQKSGDQLAVGDWLAPGALMERPAEVLFAYAYPADADAVASGLAVTKHGGKQVQLVVREQGATGVWPDLAPANVLFNLASDEDLASYREAAERAQKIANIRALADYLERNPWMPMPYTVGGQTFGLRGAEGVAKVRELAERAGKQVERELDDRTVFEIAFGRGASLSVIAWHPEGRPAEPTPVDGAKKEPYLGWAGPCAASLHIPTPGETCGVCGAEGMLSAQHVEVSASAGDTCGAECACGVTVSGFDSLAEAREALAQHIADPSGQDYGRADTAEADDPTPVSPARVPLHTGEMVGTVRDARLVDADAPEPEMAASGLTLAADQSRDPLAGTTPVVTYFSFGHGQTDPGTGKSLIDHYVTIVAPTYEACRQAMFDSRFGRYWSFDYLAGTARATEWIPRWTEHEVIVAHGTDEALADSALKAAREVLDANGATF